MKLREKNLALKFQNVDPIFPVFPIINSEIIGETFPENREIGKIFNPNRKIGETFFPKSEIRGNFFPETGKIGETFLEKSDNFRKIGEYFSEIA